MKRKGGNEGGWQMRKDTEKEGGKTRVADVGILVPPRPSLSHTIVSKATTGACFLSYSDKLRKSSH